MPMLTTCARCGYSGAHGFAAAGPYTLYVYHTECRGFYLVDREPAVELDDAVARVQQLDPRRYDALWAAYMRDPESRSMAVRLHKKRCRSDVRLTTTERTWLKLHHPQLLSGFR